MNIWQFIGDKISENKEVYLLLVIDSHGSSPGKQGFKMAVCDDGSLSGSIGGGTMEYELVERCKTLLSSNEKKNFILKQIHNEGSDESSGMICSGEQTIGFVSLNSNDISTISDIIQHIEANNPGNIRLDIDGIRLVDYDHDPAFEYNHNKEGYWEYNEVIGIKNKIYILGAGHVGFSVSKVFSLMDFEVILFDNRPDLKMLEENPFAHVKKAIDYNEIDKYIEEGNYSYVVIMTSKHDDDKLLLSLLINKKLKYLGLLGSKAKVAKFKALLPNENFSKIHAPIGVKINSISPDEIAMSIAAEIISVKNQ